MAVGTWIYEKGSATGGASGGGGVVDDAPPVSIDSVTVTEIYNGDFEIDVYWTADPTATPDNFRGVAVYIEDPDISSGAAMVLDGSQSLAGTALPSGEWAPIRTNDSFKSPAVFTVKGEYEDRTIRIYLAAFAKAANPLLIRANDPVNTPTPNITALVPKMSPQYVSGQEYAWNVTGAQVVQVDDFDNAAGPQYTLSYNYTPPDPAIPLPPGMDPFGGVEIYFQYDINDPNTQTDSGTWLPVDQTGPWPSLPYPVGASGTFRVWFVSGDINHRLNSIVAGITPYVDVTVTYPPAGEASTPGIIYFTIGPTRFSAQPDGTLWAEADATWTVPDSPRYAGTTFYRINPLPVRPMVPQFAPEPVNKLTFTELEWPKTPTPWTIAAIANDFDGHAVADPNTLPLPGYVPTAIWNIGPPGGFIGGVPGVAGATVTAEQNLSSDGVQMMRFVITGWTNPPDNGFGGVSIARYVTGHTGDIVWYDAAVGDTSLTTPWEPASDATGYDFYFVSRNLQNQRDTVLPGVTPSKHVDFVPDPGDILASRLPTDWFDTSEFVWPAGQKFQANQFAAQKIYVGSILRVGGGSGTNAASFAGQQDGQIAVYNKSNVIRAWMGEQSTTTPDDPSTGHSVFGGWFAELYVGGDSPVNAPLYATQSGAVIVGGFAAPASGTRYPYISIRKDTGVEVGRIGSALAYPDGGPPGSQQYISGAWFREFGLGGKDLSHWNVLVTQNPNDQFNSIIQMRNITSFIIDYAANYDDGSGNTTNAANHLVFGYNAYVAAGKVGTSYKFPGITLVRTGTTHGIDLVNRGLVLSGPSGKLGALVTYNGQASGADLPEPFWCSLSMQSSTNPNVTNVLLESSGAGSAGTGSAGSAYLLLRDNTNNNFFQADDTHPLLARQGLNTGPNGSHLAIKDYPAGTAGLPAGGAAQWVGAGGVATTGDIQCGSFTASGSIKSGYQFVAANNMPVIGNDGSWIGPPITPGSGGGTITGDIHGANYYSGASGPPNDFWVIDKTSGQFVGPGGVNTTGGAIFGINGISTSGAINGSAYMVANNQVINTSYQFVGSGGVDTAGGVSAGSAGIQTNYDMHFGRTLSGSGWVAQIDANNNHIANNYYLYNGGRYDIVIDTSGYGRFVGLGGVFTPGEIIGTAVSPGGQFRAVWGNYGVIFRNDGSTFYILITNPGDQYGAWSGYRPFGIDLASGNCFMSGDLSCTDISANNYYMGGQVIINNSKQFIGSGGVNTAGGGIFGSNGISTSGDISARQYWVGSSVVINTNGQFSGPNGVNTTGGAIFGANGVSTSGAMNASQYMINNATAINSSNQFVGSGGVNTGGVVNASSYNCSGSQVISNNQFVGFNGVNTTGGGSFGANGVSTSGDIAARIFHSQGLTGGTQTVTIAGVTLRFNGGLFLGSP